jgi:hypothetical protein
VKTTKTEFVCKNLPFFTFNNGKFLMNENFRKPIKSLLF